MQHTTRHTFANLNSLLSQIVKTKENDSLFQIKLFGMLKYLQFHLSEALKTEIQDLEASISG